MHQIRTMIVLGLFSLGLLSIATAQAQATPIASPAQLTVAGAQGERLIRTTLIRATSALSNLQAGTTDLTNKRGAAIPAGAIRVQVPTDQLAAGAVLAVTLTIDLTAIPSGEYSGELLLNYTNGVLVLPITVQVKHPWWWALPVLLFGVGFGGGLTYYRRHGQPYDEILVQIGRLRTQMRNDTDLDDAFKQSIEGHLADSEAALQGANLDQAQQAFEQAKKVWQSWRRDKSNWQEQFAYIKTLQQVLEEANFPATGSYMRKVQQNLRDAVRNAPMMEQGPNELAMCLQAQQKAVDRFQNLYVELHSIMDAAADQAELKQHAAAFEKRLCYLDPNHEDGLDRLEQEINTLNAQVMQQMSTQIKRPSEVLGAGSRDITHVFSLIDLPLVPSLTPVTASEIQVKRAGARLQWAGLISSIFILILLALVGFGQIYGDNPTFGMNVWLDYATLLAWGFGIETTRASIVGLGRV